MAGEEDIWTVKRILAWIESYLAKHGDEQPRVSAQWLVAEALGVSRMQLFLDLERPLTPEERAVLRDYTRRRGAGEPLQYITGYAPFRYLTVKVRPGVLIPRPETEVLVSRALELLPAAPKPQDGYDLQLAREWGLAGEAGSESDEEAVFDAQEPSELLVADICTGSGCIACALATEHSRVRVVATDIAPEAVALARENAEACGVAERIEVVECDLGAGIASEQKGAFDLVVSNPPYIPTAVLETLDTEVSDYEPALALDGGADGLDVYRRLLAWCADALKPGGSFAFELHETCLDGAAELARAAGFEDVTITMDLAGKPRVISGTRN